MMRLDSTTDAKSERRIGLRATGATQLLCIQQKRLAQLYHKEFKMLNVSFLEEIKEAKSNYWLNGILFENRNQRDEFLKYSNDNSVMTRPVWELMHRLQMFSGGNNGPLSNSEWIADRLVNVPSSVRL
jgi:dTDP-4-amino-4,6-dideoxygalactose transaminase